MTGKKHHRAKTYNENWQAEMAEYDAEFKRIEREFYNKHLVINDSGSSRLTDEENEVLTLYLNGVSCEEIANQNGIEVEVIISLLDIIRAKLSLPE